jgi:hypothetical protein
MLNSTNQKTQPETGKFQSSFTQRNSRNSKSTSTSTRPKGKSKFAQKSRGKSKAPVVVKLGPVNTYTSVCCSMPATKKACVKVGKKDALVQGLGSWRCPGCHKAAKVTVSKFKAAEPETKPYFDAELLKRAIVSTGVPIAS